LGHLRTQDLKQQQNFLYFTSNEREDPSRLLDDSSSTMRMSLLRGDALPDVHKPGKDSSRRFTGEKTDEYLHGYGKALSAPRPKFSSTIFTGGASSEMGRPQMKTHHPKNRLHGRIHLLILWQPMHRRSVYFVNSRERSSSGVGVLCILKYKVCFPVIVYFPADGEGYAHYGTVFGVYRAFI
jgi:hypothetical protein